MPTIITAELSKASRVVFRLPEDIQKEPGTISLVFTREELDNSSAKGCYNYLLSVTDIKRTRLRIRKYKDTLDLTIVDTLANLDIPITDLRYDKIQLTDFTTNYPKDISFGFLLELENLDKDPRPVFISTTQDFDIITIGGYAS